MAVFSAEKVAADQAVKADQLGTESRWRGPRQNARRRAGGELLGKVLGVVPVQDDEPPFAFQSLCLGHLILTRATRLGHQPGDVADYRRPR